MIKLFIPLLIMFIISLSFSNQPIVNDFDSEISLDNPAFEANSESSEGFTGSDGINFNSEKDAENQIQWEFETQGLYDFRLPKLWPKIHGLFAFSNADPPGMVCSDNEFYFNSGYS